MVRHLVAWCMPMNQHLSPRLVNWSVQALFETGKIPWMAQLSSPSSLSIAGMLVHRATGKRAFSHPFNHENLSTPCFQLGFAVCVSAFGFHCYYTVVGAYPLLQSGKNNAGSEVVICSNLGVLSAASKHLWTMPI